MKTNINIDNYEAYLLDYMEGNLSPEGAAELRAFVAAQGLDWNELTEELPYLETPNLVYQDKERLKKKTVFVPLFAKIAAAAAAIALLFALFWKPNSTLPQQQLMAELQPIGGVTIETEKASFPTPKERIYQIKYQTVAKKKPLISLPEERAEMPLLADLHPVSSQSICLSNDYLIANNLHSEPVPYRFEPELASIKEEPSYDEDWQPSLLDKGIIWLSQGQYSSLDELVGGALHRVSDEVVATTTHIAMNAYNKADETKMRWEEKWDRKDEE